MMKLNIFNSKVFYGTESYEESIRILDVLNKANIRCIRKSYHDFKPLYIYRSDPFNIYSKSFFESITEFHIIFVHRLDFEKAISAYTKY